MPKELARHEAIKTTLHMRGSSFSEIARQLNISITAVSLVARGRSRSRRIETAIAEQSGLSPDRLWPDRYEKPLASDSGISFGSAPKKDNKHGRAAFKAERE